MPTNPTHITKHKNTETEQSLMLHITWHGHSLFQITDGKTTIATDPHDGASLNLPTPDFKADAVTISHNHQDHTNGIHLFNCPQYKKPVDVTIGTAKLRGVATYHDDVRGERLGPNITWNITMQDIQITHLGDLGHYPTPSQMFQIGTPDILLINTGANIPLAEDYIALLNPKITIPMHYHTPNINFPYYQLKKITDFTKNKKNTQHVENTHTYTRNTLNGPPRIHIYQPPKP